MEVLLVTLREEHQFITDLRDEVIALLHAVRLTRDDGESLHGFLGRGFALKAFTSVVRFLRLHTNSSTMFMVLASTYGTS